MKLGARILKTGIAITLALFASILLHLPSPVFAGISAIFAVQPSVYRSYLTALEQIQANVIGAVFAIAFAFAFGNNPFIIGLTCILVIALTLQLRLENTISIALVTVIAIMEYQGENFFDFALLRFATIMTGIIAASLVNLIFMPPKYETKLYYRIVDNTEEIVKWIRMNSRQASDFTTLKTDIDRMKEKMIKLNHYYLLYKEERSYTKTIRFAKIRKLVLFRQMLATTSRALSTLKSLHRTENELRHMPESFQESIQNELDSLTNYHEQVLLKFIGKAKKQQSVEMLDEVETGKQELIDIFMDYQNKDDEESYKIWLHLFPLISSIINYSEEVEHLDLLVDSFYTYHKPEDELQISEKQADE
ncbi:aromatic acid exporter family protein [Bacillus cytotoxicus]|uniref:aromatic acid exporter family protein n=1 Tax=Bacillus cereus group sp. BfR-BA-01492 TaxID=2920361 RepID=UPI001F5A37BF|nr:aromatic acid exporter family protein [Bacillus cereus group sp. BfR-BA-01492]EMA6345078.1 aromatic acid exporter family protein [Bacillus cytotoxicus]